MGGISPVLGARRHAPRRLPRDGAPPQDEGKGGPGTEVRLGPLPGRDQYTPSGQRPQAPPPQPQPQPQPPTWPNGQPVYPQAPAPTHPPATAYPPPPAQGGQPTTYVPLGPGFATPGGAVAAAEPEKTAREERPLTIAGGMGGIEGKHVGLHYNISDKTSVGGSFGRIDADGIGVNSYTVDMRQYVASEKNWGIYVQPGIHALQNTSGSGKPWGVAGSAQLGLEWRTNSGITFNVFGGGAYTPGADRQLSPTAGFSIGLSF